MAACAADASLPSFLARATATIAQCDLCGQVAVRCEHTGKTRQVHAWIQHQCRQPRHEIQRLEYDMPVDEQNEYCMVQLCIDRITAETTVALLEE